MNQSPVDPLPAIAVDDLGSQPFLHHLTASVAAPAVWLSGPSGQIESGADGLYVSDRRAISLLRLDIAGLAPLCLGCELVGSDQARFAGAVRLPGRAAADSTVLVTRTRTAVADGGTEVIEVSNQDSAALDVEVELALACDLVTISEVKSGRDGRPLPPRVGPDGRVHWNGAGFDVAAAVEPAGKLGGDGVRWQVRLGPGERWRASVAVAVTGPTRGSTEYYPRSPAEHPAVGLGVDADDPRLARLVDRSIADLTSLLLADPAQPNDLYAAAGAPWYLTLFGRDAIWTARLALPLGTALAAGTARTLARRQGVRVDPSTEEAPGKILHEVRPADAAVFLPPTYYGTIDATPLFVSLLADAWRWGMPASDVNALIPAVERALAWLPEHGDADGDGFLEYSGASGLANQGWKDSPDGVRHRDGARARPPVALAEVQGYAHAAALDGAALLDAFGRPGAERWRDWAAGLRERFRSAFWVEDERGPYPAIALDGDKRPVDSLTSNIGHLLGTGLLDRAEAALVARRVGSDRLHSGWGIRTLAAGSGGFNPVGYHTGSVWAHDTAITMLGLSREGFRTEAAAFAYGLIEAAEAFSYRLPELFAGVGRRDAGRPLPYPASCHPQAWAAAAGIAVVTALVGLQPDIPNNRISITPSSPRGLGLRSVSGIAVGADALDLDLEPDGTVRLRSVPPGVTVDQPSP